MTDLDLLYEYYTSINLAVGGYATFSCRVKDDQIEKVFRKLTMGAIEDSRMAAKLIIQLGGQLY